MDPLTREPGPLVEAVRPRRAARPRVRPSPGWRRAEVSGRPEARAAPARAPGAPGRADLRRHPHRPGRHTGRSGRDDLHGARLAELACEHALVERVEAQGSPPEPAAASATPSAATRPGRRAQRFRPRRRVRSRRRRGLRPGSSWSARPKQAEPARSAGQWSSTTRLTGSPGRAAARCAPARCRGRHPGRPPT